MSLSANTMPDFELRQLVKQLTEERDEARAKVVITERSIQEIINDTAEMILEAEARGYERGGREAAKVAEIAIFPSKPTIRDILALLEPSLSPEDKP
jgi:hypothetical protein